jgi:hypothetical protein
MELKRYGIHVTALCPGFTHTEFHDVMGTREAADRLPSLMWQQPENVVREGWSAVMHGKPVCIPGTVNKLTASRNASSTCWAAPKSLQEHQARLARGWICLLAHLFGGASLGQVGTAEATLCMKDPFSHVERQGAPDRYANTRPRGNDSPNGIMRTVR